jgi:hypothetical protein
MVFDPNNLKLTPGVLPNAKVERCTSLSVLCAVRNLPRERLKDFVLIGTSQMENLRLALWLPVPTGPFATITLVGCLNPLEWENSFAIKVHPLGKEPLLG